MTADRLANLLGALSLSLTDRVSEAIEAEVGVKGTGLYALVLLHQTPGMTIDALAQMLQLTHSSTVRLVDKLVMDGFIKRMAGDDKRHVHLELTKSGQRTNEISLAVRRDCIKQVIAVLDKTTQRALEGAYEQLLETLTPDLNSACRNCRLCDEDACQLARCPVELKYQALAQQS